MREDSKILQDRDGGDPRELLRDMRAPVQWNLFASGGEISVDGTFGTATRTPLDARSWVEVVPAWLAGADSVFERLATAVPWKEHYRRLFERTFLEPRLTAEYGDVR